MIIGSGFIAQNFKKKFFLLKKYNVAIYASGVSNSQSKNANHFLREKKKLIYYRKKIEKKILVYISTWSIYDPSRKNTSYVKHKLEMENLIKKNFNKFIIFRLPEVVGYNSNKKNLINFFYVNIINNKKFKLWINSKWNIIDIDDAIKLCFSYIKFYKANKLFFSVIDVINIFEKLTFKKALYSKVKFGNLNWMIKPSTNKKIVKLSKIKFDEYYLEKVIKKYYL